LPIVVRDHGAEAPSGANLEYDAVFTALTLAAQPQEERQAGEEIIPGAEPDPQKIIECAEAVLADSNDIRAAVLYGYARLRKVGFAGLAEATGYIRSCLEEYWDSVHPQLDEEDDDDPTMRINSVLGLVEPSTMLWAARLAPLTQSAAFGRLSLRDLSVAEGEIDPPADMDNPPTPQTVSAAFQDTPREALEEIAGAIRQCSEDLAAINAVFDEKLPGQGPGLDPLATLLRKADVAISPFVAVTEAAADLGEAAGEVPAAGAPAAAAPPGAIAGRADVEKSLDRIIEYYRTNEPSSPLPLLLKRARRLIGADFMDILQDIAPQGVEGAQLVVGQDGQTEE
jgi:type VI secretion system protein ImpA